MVLFNRQCRFDIGERGTAGVSISDLRIEFKVKKTISQDSNQAEINIHNLSDDTRRRMEKGHHGILMIGYEDSGLQKAFSGDVTSIYTHKSGTERITKIELGDGISDLQKTEVAFSYSSGTSVSKIIEDLTGAFGLPYDSFGISDKRLLNGYCLAGKGRDLLDDLTSEIGASWTIQDGIIKIIADGSSDSFLAYRLTQTTGLIDSPELITKNEGGRTEESWRISSLLLPKIEPHNTILVDSKEINNGRFRVIDLEHDGDTHGMTWETVMEVEEI